MPTRRVDELLDLVGLGNAGRRRIGGYSLGMRQRLGIAAALLADPPVLILDEPANGLDPEGIRWMRELLRERADRGGTVLLSSHLLGEVEHTVDRLVVIGAGRVVADGPIGALLAGDGVRVRAVDAGALAASLRAAGLSVSAEGPALTVAGATAEQVGRIAAAGGHVLTDLRPGRPRARGPVLPADRLTRSPAPTLRRESPEESEMTAVMDRPATVLPSARWPTAARR